MSTLNKKTLRTRSLQILLITSSSITRTSAAAFSTKTAAPNTPPAVVASPIVENRAVPGLTNGMDYTMVGSSDLLVSKVCMGTMTFGQQNTLEEGVEQLNLAWQDYGINFLDTAEMYPVPGKLETKFKTHETIGAFLKQPHISREDVILATKVCGRSEHINWLRKEKGLNTRVDRKQILESVDESLKALGTDYIDLLQIHWPERYVGSLFGQADFTPSKYSSEITSFEEQLSTLQELIELGKIRHVGVSNETPYGVCSMINLAKQNPELYARIVSIQNSYSLVCRKDYEAGLAEVCFMEKVGLLPYSPLAGGVLTGKYANPDEVDEGARLKMFPGFMDRYLGSQNEKAVSAYCKIAKEAGITPTQLALSWCFNREYVCSTIIGATTIPQLKECLGSYDVKLNEETIEQIAAVYKRYTDPTKGY